MATNRTFTIIKPEAVANGHIGSILERITAAGFRYVSMKKTELTAELAGAFYAVHKERPFYGELVSYMSSGPIVAAILEKDNAVSDFRALIGATDQLKQQTEQFVRNLQKVKQKTLFTVLTLTKMLKSKGILFSQFERF